MGCAHPGQRHHGRLTISTLRLPASREGGKTCAACDSHPRAGAEGLCDDDGGLLRPALEIRLKR